DHLRRQVTTHRPTAVAISCAMPSRLPAAQDLITVAHDEGVPVVVGGRAFNEARARRLGADAWIADPRDAVDVLAGWAGQPPALARPHPPGEEFATLVIDGDVLASRVIDRLGHALGGIGGTLARQLEVGVRLLQEHLTAAVYLEDGTIFLDAVQWSAAVGERRGFPSWTAVTGLGALEAELATDMGCTRGLVE